MTVYTDEYHSTGTLLSYDGELIDAEDAMVRYYRDQERQHKYRQAEIERDPLQYSFNDIEDMLEGCSGI